MISAEGE